MPRFVILHHKFDPDQREHHRERKTHWDLMLEDSHELLTWALPRLPTGQELVICDQLPNHRLLYLNYEGPISNDRGQVTRWDSGTFTWASRKEQSTSNLEVNNEYGLDQSGIETENQLVALISGEKLWGRLTLVKSADSWTCGFSALSTNKSPTK